MRSLLVLLLCAGSAFASPRVLLLWDVKNAQTDALARSLRASGDEVVFSDTSGPGFNGENPSLSGFDVVVHLNGTTFAEDMTLSGQRALVRFVQSGGGYVHHEWNAYQLSVGQFQLLRPIILFDRTSGFGPGTLTITKVPSDKGHPVIWEIPRTFTMPGASNIGKAHVFESFPSVVLAKDQAGNDAIAIRELELGRIVGFHHAGNWNGMTLLDSGDARRLFVDGVHWAWGCDPNVKDPAREKNCAGIAALRKKGK